MTNITNVNEYMVTGVFDVACSFKADKDSEEQKTVTLRVHYVNIPLKDVITKSLSPVKISWQNGPGRSKFTTWKDRSIIDIDFTSPGKAVKTREETIEEYAVAFQKAGIDKETAYNLATKAVDNPEIVQQ